MFRMSSPTKASHGNRAIMTSEASRDSEPRADTPKDSEQMPQNAIESSGVESARSPLPLSRIPQRATPNSGKKRAGPNLTRSTPGASHHAQISTIFGDASRMIHPISTPRPLSAAARRLRMPLARTNTIKNAIMVLDDTEALGRGSATPRDTEDRPQVESARSSPVHLPCPTRHLARRGGCDSNGTPHRHLPLQPDSPVGGSPDVEPTSSGYASPTSRKRPNWQLASDELVYPDLPDLRSSVVRHHLEAATHIPTCEDDPRCPVPGIEDWLGQIHDQGPYGSSMVHEGSLAPRPNTASPSTLSSPSKRKVSSNWEIPGLQGGRRVHIRSPLRLTPRGALTEPPRRKVPRLSPAKGSPPADRVQGFVIYEDEASDKFVELSPSVERYRKGRGPQRQRCMSYWDEDILPTLKDLPEKENREMGARQVLGDLPSLTKAKGFVEGVEKVIFDFKIEP